jgi:plastocyanin
MRNIKVKIAVTSALVAMLLFSVGSITRAKGARQSGEQAQQQANETKVTIDNFSFTPQEITVPPGTTVTWVNQDDVPHTVVSTDNKFKSKALDTDDKFSFTFKDAGTYEYYCSVHPKMTAKVIVK